MKFPQIISIIAAYAVGFAVQSASSQINITWTGSGSDDNWSTPANWDVALAPSNNLIFSGTTRTTPVQDLAGPYLVNRITIASSATSGMTLSGNSIQLVGGVFQLQTGAGASVVDLNMLIQGTPVVFTVPTGGQLTINGQLSSNNPAVNRNIRLDGGGLLILNNTSNDFNNSTSASGGNVIQIDLGTLRVPSIGDYGVSGPLGAQNGTGTPFIRLGNGGGSGTLEYVGSGESNNRRFRLGNGAAASATGAGSILNNGSGTLTFTAAAFNDPDTGATVARTLTLGGSNNGVIQGVIANNSANGTIGVTKVGSGTWTLSGNNTYSGNTTVNAGTLLVNNTAGSGTGTGNVIVQSGGTLGGNGSISGAVTVNAGGTFAPGTSAGLLSVGSLTLAGTSVFEIDGTTRGVVGGYDAADVTGALVYGGTLSLVFSNTFANGTNFNLFDFGSHSGNWSAINLSGSYSGSLAFSSGLWSGTIGGQDFEFSNSTGVLSVIPEPSTWALVGAGLVFLLAIKRRRRACTELAQS